MVEVTEEELKALDELNKEKTLDELVGNLINYLAINKPDHIEEIEDITMGPSFKRVYKHYEDKNFTVNMIIVYDLISGKGNLENITITKNE